VAVVRDSIRPAILDVATATLRACHGIFGCGFLVSSRALAIQRRLIAMSVFLDLVPALSRGGMFCRWPFVALEWGLKWAAQG